MSRKFIHAQHEDWRERLFWTSLAVGLIAMLLLGLVALAQLEKVGDRGEREPHTRVAGLEAMPGSTALMTDLLLPPPAPAPIPPPRLPLIGSAPRAGPERGCGAAPIHHPAGQTAAGRRLGELCGVAP